MERKVNVIEDLNGKKIVVIHDIRFRGKRSVNWDDVEEYLKNFVGKFYEIADTKDIVYIGEELPDEYTSSKYTYSLQGTNASLIIRHAKDGKMYLYDIMDIKKETSNLFQP